MNETTRERYAEQIMKAGVLIEAMPWLQRFRGQTFLIKFGGSAMDDPELGGAGVAFCGRAAGDG